VPGIASPHDLCGADFWGQFFRQRRESGDDLDWAGLWTTPFLAPLRGAGVRTFLELGWGTGNDTARLTGEGYSVTAVDLSGEAFRQARARFGPQARFLVADMTRRFPFPDESFHAVMSNVAGNVTDRWRN
jgi:SAM-dependent methyltransferase